MANEPRLAIESIAGQRAYQEDAVLAEELADGRILVAVADGMGGHAAGEVASALALEALLEAIEQGRSLTEAFTLANARVHDQAREPDKRGMGTTLVAALVTDGQVEWANVGDSRGYVISDRGIDQLTEDHSFVAEAVKRGQSEAEAMAGPWKDALTRSIGTEEEVRVDTFGPEPVPDNCALVVCSDGLYKTLGDADLLRLYAQSSGPEGAAQALVSSALQNGSDDNISVAIAEFGEVRRETAAGTIPLDYVPEHDATPTAGSPVGPDPHAEHGAYAGSADPIPGDATSRESDSPDAAPLHASDQEAAPGGGSAPPAMVLAVALAVVVALLAVLVLGIR